MVGAEPNIAGSENEVMSVCGMQVPSDLLVLLHFTLNFTLKNPVGVMLGCCTAQRAVQ